MVSRTKDRARDPLLLLTLLAYFVLWIHVRGYAGSLW